MQLSHTSQNPGMESTVERDRERTEAAEGVKLSRAEAKLAWLAAGGDTDRAVRQLLRDRQVKVGGSDSPQCLTCLVAS